MDFCSEGDKEMRSLLFVPADSAKKLDKAMTSGADALIIDLEDFDGRARARESAAAFLEETVVASQRPRRRCLPLTRSSNSASVSVPGTSRQNGVPDEHPSASAVYVPDAAWAVSGIPRAPILASSPFTPHGLSDMAELRSGCVAVYRLEDLLKYRRRLHSSRLGATSFNCHLTVIAR